VAFQKNLVRTAPPENDFQNRGFLNFALGKKSLRKSGDPNLGGASKMEDLRKNSIFPQESPPGGGHPKYQSTKFDKCFQNNKVLV